MDRILIIEDDYQLRKLLTIVLEKEGYEIIGASNGKIGLKLSLEEPFDLILTDLVMPDKEGLETIIEIRKKSVVKIIAMSGGGSFEPEVYLAMAKKLGANKTIEKPFDMSALISMVKELLSER